MQSGNKITRGYAFVFSVFELVLVLFFFGYDVYGSENLAFCCGFTLRLIYI